MTDDGYGNGQRMTRQGLRHCMQHGGRMLLKVGELAKRTGLTVRALHHYDTIGLLKPSGRSSGGYRLYNETDVARLHGIQALRQLGLPLSEIDSVLVEGGKSLPLILSEQIQALDHEMAKAAELRNQLVLIQDKFRSGDTPEINNWLATLALMATYGKYFNAAELRSIFQSWSQLEAEWQPLITDIRDAIESGIRSDSLEAQPLARRWMELSARWMEGDFNLLARWSEMCRNEPVTHGRTGIDTGMFRFVSHAIDLRLAALERHLLPTEWRRLNVIAECEWVTLTASAERLIRDAVPVESEAAQALAAKWRQMFDHLTNKDPILERKLITAMRSEPLLAAGAPVSVAARDYIRRAFEVKSKLSQDHSGSRRSAATANKPGKSGTRKTRGTSA
jgi:DNA-binding transcriptional MerR regulator